MKKILAVQLIATLVLGLLIGTTNAVSASLSPSNKTVTTGDTVTVTVNLGQSVSAAQFELNFDSSELKYKSKSKGTFSASTKRYGYFSEDDLEDLSSVTFTFEALKPGTAKVSVSALQVSKGTATKVSIPVANSAIITVNDKEQPKPPTPPVNNENQGNPNQSGTNQENQGSSSNSGNSEGSSTSTSKPNNTTNKDNNNNQLNNQQTVAEPEMPTENVDQNNTTLTFAPNELIEMSNTTVRTLENRENNVIIKALPKAFEFNEQEISDILLKVSAIRENVSEYRTIDNIINEVQGDKRYFDIKLVKDNIEVQPNGYVTVCIAIPQEYNKEQLELYYIDEQNEKYEEIKGEVQENYYTFTTNHFSVYALVDKSTKETEEQKTFIQKLMDNKTILFIIIGIVVIILIIVIIIIKRKN